MAFRLKPSGQVFFMVVSSHRSDGCTKRLTDTTSSGLHFCYVSFENGVNGYFSANGLVYSVNCVQTDGPVPRLPQLLNALAALGRH